MLRHSITLYVSNVAQTRRSTPAILLWCRKLHKRLDIVQRFSRYCWYRSRLLFRNVGSVDQEHLGGKHSGLHKARHSAKRRREMNTLRVLSILLLTLFMASVTAVAQQECTDEGTWTSLNFGGSNDAIDIPLLLTDGRVMVQYVGTVGNRYQDWYALTPDNSGNYGSNNWSILRSLTTVWGGGYGPSGFASAVLPNGHVVVQGGEFNLGGGSVWSRMGAIYDPVGNTWTQLNWPGSGTNSAWPYIGDAQSIVLANGTYMVAACSTANFVNDNCPDLNGHVTYEDEALLVSESNQTWQTITSPANGKADANAEEGWTLLPGGNVLTVETGTGSTTSEVFNPSITPGVRQGIKSCSCMDRTQGRAI